MITSKEKRFIRSWQYQREGGRWPYYLLYTFAGGFIITLLSYVLLLWILQVRVPRPLWLLPACSIVAAAIIAVLAWGANEKKFREIIRREIKHGENGSPLV